MVYNIVLFGESGVGKSSIVNMLVGNDAAKISGNALGCTLESKGYDFYSNGKLFRIHDTAGLNEGEAGRVPSRDAILRLCKLIYGLGDGVSLLIFCMRAPRIKESVKHNWVLFHDVICRKKVPILLVITGLEEEEDMDAWCYRDDNWDGFRKHGIHFNAVAGVTASRGKRKGSGLYVFQEEYDISKVKLKKLIAQHHLVSPWKVERVKWFNEIYETQYEWWDCFNNFPRQVMVDKVKGEAQRLISECGMSPEDAEKLAEDLEKL